MTDTKTTKLTQQVETKDEDESAILTERSKISGSASPEFTKLLKNQTTCTFSGIDTNIDSLDVYSKISEDALKGLNPCDEAEGMLIAQMIAVHNATMNALFVANVATKSTSMTTCETKTNLAIKLSRTYATQMQTLHMYRNTLSENKINVSRVHVHDGGQAIVGNIKQEKQ